MQETPEAGMGKERDSPQRLQKAALPPPLSEPEEALTLQNGERIQLCCLSPYIYGKLLEQQEVANLTTDGRPSAAWAWWRGRGLQAGAR